MKVLWNYLKKILPWLAAAGVFTYLFYQIPPEKVFQAFKHVRPFLFVSYAVVYFSLVMVFDCFSLSWVLSKFCIPITFREIFPARGVSYLLALINYNAGQAALAFFLKKTKNASFFRALGSLLFVMVIDLYWISLLALIGSFCTNLQFGDLNLNEWVQKITLILSLAFLVHLSFWRGWFAKLFPFKTRFRFFDWIRGRHLFQTFHEATVLDYVKIAFLRLPIHGVIIAALYFAATTYESHIPFRTIITTVPVILLIGMIPLTPGGLGTVQAATIELLKNQIQSPLLGQGLLGPEEILFAISLSWMFANYFLKALTGSICLKLLPKKLFTAESTPSASL